MNKSWERAAEFEENVLQHWQLWGNKLSSCGSGNNDYTATPSQLAVALSRPARLHHHGRSVVILHAVPVTQCLVSTLTFFFSPHTPQPCSIVWASILLSLPWCPALYKEKAALPLPFLHWWEQSMPGLSAPSLHESQTWACQDARVCDAGSGPVKL